MLQTILMKKRKKLSDDAEDIAVSNDPHFIEVMKRSREEILRGEVISSKEIIKRYGVKESAKAKRRRVRG